MNLVPRHGVALQFICLVFISFITLSKLTISMGSLIPGYEYDIFISYRQKDNKHDGWVTEFVNQLKGELESTFKEDISVYFDINPHDGLLETHDVDASLKDKLKCLVFIPIISRTYCDPKSFAWEHEFKSFIEQASKDQFGLKVKLPNGNVSSRVLPIQIHDLYPEDKATIETELGGVLRAIEFIYKEPGVNRPLTAADDKETNLNKTKYRNQINKAAIAIEELIHGIRILKTAPAGNNFQFDHQVPDVKEGSKIKSKDEKLGFKRKLKRWIVSGLLVTLTIAITFGIFKIIEKSKLANDIANLEKSIAVLPFVNDSPDKDNEYFCNGMMDEILNNLQKIKDFRVLSRTSTEQYRGTSRPTIPKIAKALDVNYIVEGSVQKYGNTFRLRVQLIAATNEKHLWGESFEQEINLTKDIFKIQTKIAQTIAAELKANITPEEKQLIDETPTGNLDAYIFYQRGQEELRKYLLHNEDKSALRRAEEFYHQALIYDRAYAQAFTGLARVYWTKHFNEEYFSESGLDSVLILLNKALSFDNKLAEAYILKARYFFYKSDIENALIENEKAISINPNSWEAYNQKGNFYYYSDHIKYIENLQKAASLNHGPEFANLLMSISDAYWRVGFNDESEYYLIQALNLGRDSSRYYEYIAAYEFDKGNIEKGIELSLKAYLLDTTRYFILNESVAFRLAIIGRYEESLKYYKKYLNKAEENNHLDLNYQLRIGYAFWVNGYKKEAAYYFNKQIEYCKNAIKLDRNYAKNYLAYYDLAAVYAFLGEKDKSYENLKKISQIKIVQSWLIFLINNDPLFNTIRNEPDFQNIVNIVEAKYQSEHERVRKWLEDQAKL